MSQMFDLLKEAKIGYISEDYGFQDKIFSLEELLNLDLIEFKNIEIPLYYLEEQILLNFKAIRSGFYPKEEEYLKWLKDNHLESNSHSKILFKEDCDYVAIQKNAKKILDVIVEKVCKKLNANKEEVKCAWVSGEQESFMRVGYLEEINIPDKYECLLDLDDSGILIAFKE